MPGHCSSTSPSSRADGFLGSCMVSDGKQTTTAQFSEHGSIIHFPRGRPGNSRPYSENGLRRVLYGHVFRLNWTRAHRTSPSGQLQYESVLGYIHPSMGLTFIPGSHISSQKPLSISPPRRYSSYMPKLQLQAITHSGKELTRSQSHACLQLGREGLNRFIH